MRLLYPIIFVMFSMMWLTSITESQTLTSCNMKTNVSLFENTLPLKIDSCEILHHAIVDRINEGADKDEINTYLYQWIKNCTKPVEFDLINQKE